ncbi:MAG: lipopolysaccharide biosynthesis protein [Phycisphaerales bacterium]
MACPVRAASIDARMENGVEQHEDGGGQAARVDPKAPRSRRTSTRLLVFAGSSWLRIFATFLVTIALLPLLVRYLGLELTGLYYLFAIMTRFLAPLRGALARVMTREVAGALAAGDNERVTRVFTNAVSISACTALLAALIMGTLTAFAPQVFTVPAPHADLARFALACETLIVAAFLFFNPWLNLFIASQRVLSENISRTIERSLDLVAAGLAFWVVPKFGPAASVHPFVAFTCCRAILRVGQYMVRSFVISRAIPQARLRPSKLSKRELKELSKEGGWSLGNASANVGFYLTDQPFMNVFFGPAYNALFAIVTRLQGMGQMLGNNVAFGLEAMVADHHEMGRHHLNKRIMLTGMRVTSSITVFCTVCVVVLAPQIVDVWLGKNLRNDPAIQSMGYDRAITLIWTFSAILLPSVWFSQAMLVSTRVLYGMGHNRLFSPWLMAAAAIKIVIAWVGLRFFGAGPMWVVWSTVIAQAWCFGWIFPRLIKKVFDLSMARVFLETYILPLLSTLPSAALLAGASLYVRDWTLMKLAGALAAAGVVYAPMFFFAALRSDERARVIHLVHMGPKAALKQVKGGRRKKRGGQSEGDDSSGGGGDF